MDVCELSDRGQIVRSGSNDVFEFFRGFVEPPELEQCPTQRHPCGEIGRVLLKAGSRDFDRLFEIACSPVLFRELRKRNRRRILLDPASQFFYPRIVGHAPMVW